jgi:hypothetical protein
MFINRTLTLQDLNTIIIDVLHGLDRERYQFSQNQIGETTEYIVEVVEADTEKVEVGRLVAHPGVLGMMPTFSAENTAMSRGARTAFRQGGTLGRRAQSRKRQGS